MRLRLARPDLVDAGTVEALMREALTSGTLTRGPLVERFEGALASYLSAPHAVAVSSGTAALHLGLLALDLSPDDEVIVPAYTFPATANAVEFAGARTALVDVDLDTFLLTPSLVRRSTGPRTRAVIPVHLFGNPTDVPGIRMASPSGTLVVEDAAGALGARWGNDACGSLGDVGCFSFHPRKLLTTGEGGLLVCHADAVAERVRAARNHGFGATHATGENAPYRPGLNYRLSEVQAALGLAQVPHIAAAVAWRGEMRAEIVDRLEPLGFRFQASLDEATPAWTALVLRHPGTRAETLIDSLRGDGIESTVGTYGVHLLSHYAERYDVMADSFPNATTLAREAVAIPFHRDLTGEDLDHLTDAMARAVRTS